jgi:hypothetical protein
MLCSAFVRSEARVLNRDGAAAERGGGGVVWMQRSEIRVAGNSAVAIRQSGLRSPTADPEIPDFASLHPGNEAVADAIPCCAW